MNSAWTTASWLVALPVLVLMAFLSIEFLAALLPAASGRRGDGVPRPTVAVLVPAHNEASVIDCTLDSLLPQLAPGDRLIVVADNCSDDTVAVARARGATVIERCDVERIGKGYALDWGIRFLHSDPPQVVVTVDADTPAHAGAIDVLARLAQSSQRPVQATCVLVPPPSAEMRHRISAFAYRVKNRVRPAGLARLGLPCLLAGSGMAFPWSVIARAELATDFAAEDLMLTAQLALRGQPPLVCADAFVSGVLPRDPEAMQAQKRRWVHGHLQTLWSQVPRLVAFAVRWRRLDVLALALELAVPPLSLLVLWWVGSTAATALAGVAGASWLPTAALVAGAALCAAAGLAVWARLGRAELPLRSVLALPAYVWARVPLYAAFLTGRQTTWTGRHRGQDRQHPPSSPRDRTPPDSQAEWP